MTTTLKTTINHVAIHIHSAGSADTALVFVHGNSGDALMWSRQLADSTLQAAHRLVAFDLPGHGGSGRATDYGMQSLASFIPAVVAGLGITRYVLVGISYGTCLIGEAAPHLPGCVGIVAVSPNITSNTVHPGVWLNPFPEAMAMGAPMVDDETLERFAHRMVNRDEELAKAYVRSYKNTDPDFRVGVGNTIATAGWTDELDNILQLKVPVAVVFGQQEQMVHTNYLDGFPALWRSSTNIIADAGHLVQAEQPEAFNKLLMEFAADVFK